MNHQLEVKYPVQIKFIVNMVWVLCLMTFMLIRNPHRKPFDQYLTVFEVVWIAFCVFCILFVCIRAARKPKALIMEESRLILEGEEINHGEIQEILLDRNMYGIKMRNRRLVPMRLCFALDKDQPTGEYELLGWAKENHIKVTRRFFMKWI